MLKEIIEFMAGVKMTIVSAAFLFISLGFMIAGKQPAFDTIWLTIVISGVPIVYRAFYKLIYVHAISSPLLITTAMAAAIAIGELFAAGEVALIMAVGEILEDITVDKAKRGLGRLLELTPPEGRRICGGKESKVRMEDVQPGDILRVLPGETIPADAIIIEGNTSVNQAALTGESIPVDKSAGDMVMAGTINCFGAIDIKVSTVKDTYLQKMINLVKEAQENKAPTQKIVDRWAAILVPTAMVIALLTYFITGEIIRAVTVLVVFCPCALVLATPTSIMAAIGHATKNGVLIKSGAALEEMGRVDTIVFDKTGTLTTGEIHVANIVVFDKNISEEKLLTLAASIEALSEHALAQAVANKAKQENTALLPVKNFQVFPGRGVSGQIEGKNIFAGNMAFMRDSNIVLSDENKQQIQTLQAQGKALILLGYGDLCIGVLALTDSRRPDIENTLDLLQKENIDSIVLTGDNEAAAHFFARGLNIKHIFADLLPQNKVEKIKELQQNGRQVCMVGDGINDAPALKTANIGVAMGNIGSDIAVDAADVALINDRISSLPYLKRLSNLTIKTIKVNISISMTLNFIGIILSFYGILGPMSGAIMHNVGSVFVILNASRIYHKEI